MNKIKDNNYTEQKKTKINHLFIMCTENVIPTEQVAVLIKLTRKKLKDVMSEKQKRIYQII